MKCGRRRELIPRRDVSDCFDVECSSTKRGSKFILEILRCETLEIYLDDFGDSSEIWSEWGNSLLWKHLRS